MAVLTTIWKWLVAKRRFWGYLALTLLVTLGLMNLIYILTYLAPTDGAEWAMQNGRLTVTQTDLDAETRLQVGDVLTMINERIIEDKEDYDNWLYDEARIGSTYLYVLERAGSSFEPFVTIRGMREEGNRDYFIYAFAGFAHLIFTVMLLSQNVAYASKRTLVLFCLCVYMTFAFHYTNRFISLDWISFFLDLVGQVLLPSALASVAVSRALYRSRFQKFVQALHWVPSLLLLALQMHFLLLLPLWDNLGFGQDFFERIENLQSTWSGSLIAAALVLLVVRGERRSQEHNLTFFWCVGWAPYMLLLFDQTFPFIEIVAAIAPVLLLLALLIDWGRNDELYLGEIGKKTAVYGSMIFVLLLTYFLVYRGFQALVGPKFSTMGQTVVLGIVLILSAVLAAPLKQYFAEWVDRLVYGKRFEFIRVLSDFSGLNRADMNIDRFLEIINRRIKEAFAVERGFAAKVGANAKAFKVVSEDGDHPGFIFEELPTALLNGDIVRAGDVKARLIGKRDGQPFASGDYICPIRTSGNLNALIVFSRGGDNPMLSPEELRLLQSLINQCDVLMENMELYQAVNQKVESINQLKEYNENIIESSRVGILTTDEVGRAVSCNHAFADLTGQPREQVMGQRFEQLFQRLDTHSHRQVRSGFTAEGIYRNRLGKDLVLEIQETPLKTKENHVYGTLFLVEDIRERKEFNEKLQQQEKLASIGMLAAGVAHEINTPLTGIASYSQLLVNDGSLSEANKELLELIQAQSNRAAKIVNELLNFSRKENAPRGPVDVVSVIDQTLRFLKHTVQKRNVLVTFREPALRPEFQGYANQLQQVFINLIMNALDAMQAGGELEIGVEEQSSFVHVWVKDSGSGMDEKTRSLIFDPFFTTKEAGKGTGLGLAVVYNILQDHQASVHVDSKLGEGTAFHIYFPKRTSAQRAGSTAAQDSAS